MVPGAGCGGAYRGRAGGGFARGPRMSPARTGTARPGATNGPRDDPTPGRWRCGRQEGTHNQQGRATYPAHKQAQAVLQHGRGEHYKGV